MMQARSAPPGATPVLHFAGSAKLPLTGLVHAALHCELNSAHPCRALARPTATTDVIAPPPVGVGTTNDPVIAPVPSALTVVSSAPPGELACSSTDSLAL